MGTQARHPSRHGQTWPPGPRAWRRSWRGQPHNRVAWTTFAIAGAALVLLVVIIVMCIRSMSHHSRPEFAAAERVPSGNDVSLPVSTFADGRARFYRYVSTTGRETRFFVLESADGVVRAALDACDRCFRRRRGFRQVGALLICNACGRTLSTQDMGVLKDGCNPVSLDPTLDNDRLIVRADALEKGGDYFD